MSFLTSYATSLAAILCDSVHETYLLLRLLVTFRSHESTPSSSQETRKINLLCSPTHSLSSSISLGAVKLLELQECSVLLYRPTQHIYKIPNPKWGHEDRGESALCF